MNARHLGTAALLAWLLLAPHATAQRSRWESARTITGGFVTSLLFTDDTTAYAGTMVRGIFRSTDNGRTWDPAGAVAANAHVKSLQERPGGELVTIVTSGIFQSTDEGETWSGHERIMNASAFDELAGVLYRDDDTGTMRSTDMGASWTISGGRPAAGFINDFAISPADRALLAASHTGIYRSTDGGGSWDTVLAHLEGPPSLSIRDIVASPDRMLYATGFSMGIIRSSDDGRTWTTAGAGLPVSLESGNGWIVTADRDGRLVGAMGAEGVLYASDDSARTWTATGGRAGFRPYTLAFAPDGQLWIGVAEIGLLVSSDRGRTVRESNDGLTAELFQARLAADRNAVYAASGAFLYRSTDVGTSWVRLGRTGSLAISAVSTGPGGELIVGGGGIGLSRDTGRTWWFSEMALPSPGARSISSIVVADSGRVYLATANGFFWTSLTDTAVGGPDFGGVLINGVAVLSDGSVMVGASVDEGPVLRRVDDAWRHVDIATTAGRAVTGVRDIVSDGRGRVLVAAATGIFSSTDDGVTWRADSVAEREYDGVFQRLLIADDAPSYAIAGYAVFSRAPGDSVWRREELPLVQPPTGITLDSNGRVLVAVTGGQIYRTTAPVTGVPLEPRALAATMRVAPNPANDVLRLELTAATPIAGELELVEIDGRTGLRLGAVSLPTGRSQLTLPLDGLAAGAWLLRLVSPAGALTVPVTVVR